MKALKLHDHIEDAYIIAVIIVLGIVAFISAVLVAYPALAYLGSKLMF